MSNAVAVVQPQTQAISHPSGGVLTDPTTFDVVVKQAAMLAKSTIIPDAYQGNPANVLVALEYAHRLRTSVLAVMQNLDVIHGRPGLRATFLIGTVNASGRFTPLRFQWEGKEGTDERGCRCVATDKGTGEECVGPLITLGMAKEEGWYGRKGSKWKTAPELMTTYRAATWWVRIYAPEMALGLQTADEVEDVGPRAPEPQERATAVLAALHAEDVQQRAPSRRQQSAATDVQDAEVVDEGSDLEAATAQERERLNLAWFQKIKDVGWNDADRRAFQQRIHKEGRVSSPKCGEWSLQEFRIALDAIDRTIQEEARFGAGADADPFGEEG